MPGPLEKRFSKKCVGTLVTLTLALMVGACEQQSSSSSRTQTKAHAKPKPKPVLQIKTWKYVVPLRGISQVDIWEQPGARNVTNNRIIHSVTDATKVGILEREELSQGSVYFHVDLGNEKRGYVGRPYVTNDENGNVFYEKNSSTGERLRDGKDYSFSNGENCILHVAALMAGDLKKGEYETTAELEARKAEAASTIPWFKNNLTYTYVYPITGKYDADKEVFEYNTSYGELEYQQKSTDYSVDRNLRKETPYLEFDEDCTSTFGYGTVSWTDGYETKYGKSKTLLQIMGAKYPSKFLDPEYSSIGKFGVHKWIERSRAPSFKKAVLMFGINPTAIQSVSKGSDGYYSAPSNHHTILKGEVSYIFLITSDGKNTIESYVSNGYQKTWQKDLQSQLAIAGYDVGVIDGVAGGSTTRALETAVADGVLPNAEASMRSTMVLVNHNRK